MSLIGRALVPIFCAWNSPLTRFVAALGGRVNVATWKDLIIQTGLWFLDFLYNFQLNWVVGLAFMCWIFFEEESHFLVLDVFSMHLIQAVPRVPHDGFWADVGFAITILDPGDLPRSVSLQIFCWPVNRAQRWLCVARLP